MFRHETIRPEQQELYDDIKDTIAQEGILLAHAPTGLGKTDATLGPAIEHVVHRGGKVFFITPKKSQHRIALDVVRGLQEKFGLDIVTVNLVGRKDVCKHHLAQKVDQGSFYTVCERLKGMKRCSYFEEVKRANIDEMNTYEFSPEAIADYFCTYELLLKAIDRAQVIICDYAYLLSPYVRNRLFLSSELDIGSSIVIVDEAHNLPKRADHLLTMTLTDTSLRIVENELAAEGYLVRLERIFEEQMRTLLQGGKECPVESEMIITSLLQELGSVMGIDTDIVSTVLRSKGAEKVLQGNKSGLITFADFLERWEEFEATAIFTYAKNDKGKLKLTKKSLDCSALTHIFSKTHATIAMSGTLYPLEMYRDILGLHQAQLKQYVSPFHKNQKMQLIAKGVTTRFRQRGDFMYQMIAEYIITAYNTKKNVAVFFPSFEILYNVYRYIDVPVAMQTEKMKQQEVFKLADTFGKSHRLLFAVQGGSLSEGYDFSHMSIDINIVVGIPFQEPSIESEAYIEYCEKMFGKGRDYAYVYPALNKVVQTGGRAIRSMDDKAIVLYLDERLLWTKYNGYIGGGYVVTSPHGFQSMLEQFFIEHTN